MNSFWELQPFYTQLKVARVTRFDENDTWWQKWHRFFSMTYFSTTYNILKESPSTGLHDVLNLNRKNLAPRARLFIFSGDPNLARRARFLYEKIWHHGEDSFSSWEIQIWHYGQDSFTKKFGTTGKILFLLGWSCEPKIWHGQDSLKINLGRRARFFKDKFGTTGKILLEKLALQAICLFIYSICVGAEFGGDIYTHKNFVLFI